jgi:adenylate cyclase
LSEKLHPRETVKLLNDCFTVLVQAIHASKGVVDKFIGDAVMAVYGLDDVKQPCELSVKSAYTIFKNLEKFNQTLTARGISPLNIGIGIHFGTVIAGNIGSKERLEYTVIGDAVNTASRLETLSKQVSSRAVISMEVFERLSPEMQSKVPFLGEFELKGKAEKIRAYGIL